MRFGTTHVAVGAQDLSVLREATLVGEPSADSPLRFAAFDMSPYAVAKNTIIGHMLNDVNTP